MAQVDKEFERRQLLRAYRRGLISDELFAEQMAEVDTSSGERSNGPAAVPNAPAYRIGDRSYESERALLLDFLDEFRAAETFGGVVLALWWDVARDPELRGGLRVVCEREAMHGRLLAGRLVELGGHPRKELPEELRESARARLGSRRISDADKIADLARHLPDVATALAPIRRVIEQITDDGETRALLAGILEEEASTVRWIHAMKERLAAGSHRPPVA